MNLFEDTYLTISLPSQGLFKDRGSKFISFSFPVNSDLEVKNALKEIKKEHPSATHHCFAFRLGADKLIVRANDDGEPSNTAGKPILNQIIFKDLTNILIVVVRYFGGTLLGVNGLINAYKEAAMDVIKNSTVVEKTVCDVYEIAFDYLNTSEIMKIIKDEELVIKSQIFNEKTRLVIEIRKSRALKVTEQFQKISNLELQYIKTA